MTVTQDDTPRELPKEDGHLVDLVATALVDPNLHTDVRMRLQREITELLRDTDRDLQTFMPHEQRERPDKGHSDHLPDFLTAVLVDPMLHTDTRMRLHRQITEMLHAIHARRE